MAKRVRSNRSARRPGQTPNRSKNASADAAPSADRPDETAVDPTVVDDASYSEVEVDETAVAALAATTPPPAQTPSGPRRPRRRERRRASGKQRSDDLAARAAAETVWVREDLRRIGVVSVVLLVALAVAWVIFGVLDVLSLY